MVGGGTGTLVQAHKEVECSPIFHSQPSLLQKAASVLSQWCCNWPELPTSLSTDLQTKYSWITYNTVSKQTFRKSVHEPLLGTKANSAQPIFYQQNISQSQFSLSSEYQCFILDMARHDNPTPFIDKSYRKDTITLQFNQSTIKQKTLLPQCGTLQCNIHFVLKNKFYDGQKRPALNIHSFLSIRQHRDMFLFHPFICHIHLSVTSWWHT